jgi:hypothetical protein
MLRRAATNAGINPKLSAHWLRHAHAKLLVAIAEMLEGRDLDAATLKRTAEIMAATQELSVEKPDIPKSFGGPEVPDDFSRSRAIKIAK